MVARVARWQWTGVLEDNAESSGLRGEYRIDRTFPIRSLKGRNANTMCLCGRQSMTELYRPKVYPKRGLQRPVVHGIPAGERNFFNKMFSMT